MATIPSINTATNPPQPPTIPELDLSRIQVTDFDLPDIATWINAATQSQPTTIPSPTIPASTITPPNKQSSSIAQPPTTAPTLNPFDTDEETEDEHESEEKHGSEGLYLYM